MDWKPIPISEELLEYIKAKNEMFNDAIKKFGIGYQLLDKNNNTINKIRLLEVSILEDN